MFQIGDKLLYGGPECCLIGIVLSTNKRDYKVLITKCNQYEEVVGMEVTFGKDDPLLKLTANMELLYV